MSDKMKVKVTKLNNPYVWYRGLVGDVFEVEQEAKGDKFFCPTENGSFYISDCELVAETKGLIKLPVRVVEMTFDRRIIYQIWDADCLTISSFNHKPIADHICSLLNQPQRAKISEDKVKLLKDLFYTKFANKEGWVDDDGIYIWQWIVDNLINKK